MKTTTFNKNKKKTRLQKFDFLKKKVLITLNKINTKKNKFKPAE